MNTQEVTEEALTNSPTQVESEEVSVFNIYPVIRHIFLTLCVLLAVTIILFLLYQNGKSIYDKGL